MSAEWRTVPAWPYPQTKAKASGFRTSWAKSLVELETEIGRSGGTDVMISIVATPDQLTYAGYPRAGMKVLYRGVEVIFTRAAQRLAFHDDAFGTLHENIHAITLTLEALRAIDRYGATSGAEQYAGFAALPPGDVKGGSADRGRLLVEGAGTIADALKKHHPDKGGNARDFADVQAYRQANGL